MATLLSSRPPEAERAARPARRRPQRHDDVHLVVEPHDVLPEARAAHGDHALDVHALLQLLHNGGGLQRELARGPQDEPLDAALHEDVHQQLAPCL